MMEREMEYRTIDAMPLVGFAYFMFRNNRNGSHLEDGRKGMYFLSFQSYHVVSGAMWLYNLNQFIERLL